MADNALYYPGSRKVFLAGGAEVVVQAAGTDKPRPVRGAHILYQVDTEKLTVLGGGDGRAEGGR